MREYSIPVRCAHALFILTVSLMLRMAHSKIKVATTGLICDTWMYWGRLINK